MVSVQTRNSNILCIRDKKESFNGFLYGLHGKFIVRSEECIMVIICLTVN